MTFSISNRWEAGDGPSDTEDRLLEKYWKREGGLLFTEFSVTKGMDGRSRRVDAIRFPNPPVKEEAYCSKGNYDIIRQIIQRHEVELIEVHEWSFHAFGQVVGKAGIVKNRWNPYEVNKTVIPTNSRKSYYPNNERDEPTHEVFDKFGIEVEVLG